MGGRPLDPPQFAQFAGADQVAQFGEERIGSLVEHGGKNLSARRISGDEPFAVGFVDRDRFFHQHMKTGLECGDAIGRVGEVRGRDQHRIDEAGADEGRAVGKSGNAGEGRGGLAAGIADRGEDGAGDFAALQGAGVGRTHQAQADDADADFVHEKKQLTE